MNANISPDGKTLVFHMLGDIKGLMLPGKSNCVEPMAARIQPDNVRSAHQSMHHLVADSPWSDRPVLSAVADQVLPELLGDERPVWWIIDGKSYFPGGYTLCWQPLEIRRQGAYTRS
jgi:SRSO17 transposase